MLEIKNDIKRSRLDSSEVFYAEDENVIGIPNGDTNNIEIDIEIQMLEGKQNEKYYCNK